jgi:ribonuclease BN (tRNA processing enzyme)
MGTHTSAAGVARVADAAAVKRLAITSIPSINDRPDTLERMAATVRSGFAGDVIMARDLMTLDV